MDTVCTVMDGDGLIFHYRAALYHRVMTVLLSSDTSWWQHAVPTQEHSRCSYMLVFIKNNRHTAVKQ